MRARPQGIYFSCCKPDIRSKINAVRLRIEQLEDKYADNDLSRAGYPCNRNRLRFQPADLERQDTLAALPSPLVVSLVSPETSCRWSAKARLYRLPDRRPGDADQPNGLRPRERRDHPKMILGTKTAPRSAITVAQSITPA
jgi:hypothetical protein